MKGNKALRLLVYVFVLILSTRLLIVFSKTMEIVADGRSIDLRNRMVGTRVALLGKDPYFYIEQPGGDERLIDPLAFPNFDQTRLSVSPAALLIHTPYAWLSFSKIIYIWFIFQWVLMLSGFYLITKVTERSKAISLLIFLIVANSPVWILHLLYSQIYILYTFLSILILYLIKRNQNKYAFFVLGILVLSRPPYVIVPMMLFLVGSKYTKYIKVFLSGVAVTAIATILFFNPLIWQQYLKGMMEGTNAPAMVEIDVDNYAQKYYPEVLEGWQVPQISLGFSPEYEVSFRTFILEKTNLLLNNSILGLVILILYIAALVFAKKKLHSFQSIFAFAVLVALISEYFIPARRYVYADIQWVVPLSLGTSLVYRLWQKETL